MKDKHDHRIDEKLPVTAEVGGEGGSYSDATMQKDTFKGSGGNERIDPKAVAGTGVAGETVEPDGGSAAEDLLKYPTDR